MAAWRTSTGTQKLSPGQTVKIAGIQQQNPSLNPQGHDFKHWADCSCTKGSSELWDIYYATMPPVDFAANSPVEEITPFKVGSTKFTKTYQ